METKRCCTCRSGKPLAAFSRNRSHKDGLHPQCKSCNAADGRAYNANGGAPLRAHQVAYQVSHRGAHRIAIQRWQKANREKARTKLARWYEANPGLRAAYESARRARKRNLPGRGISPRQWQQVLNDALGLCAYCNERKPLSVDHIEPLDSGGEHDVLNTAAACKSCNSSKHTTPLLVWLARRAA